VQSIFISGNLGKDAELRQTQGGDDVCSFSVGVKQGYGDKASTNWFRCNVWGKRGRTLHQYLRKGVKVVVSGELSIGEYQGKPQFDVRANEVEFMSRAEGGQQPASSNGGSAYGSDLDDDVPF
jgi:single-strand DNA-binding protein